MCVRHIFSDPPSKSVHINMFLSYNVDSVWKSTFLLDALASLPKVHVLYTRDISGWSLAIAELCKRL